MIQSLQSNRMISLFPVLPWYLRILPKGRAKKSILRVYSLIKFRKRYRRLSQALTRVKENIELAAVKPVRAKLAAQIIEITTAIIAEVEATINDIDTLENKLRSVQQKLAEEYPKHVPGETVFSGHPNFQLFLANHAFTKECYEEFSPKNDEIQKVLLEKMKFLSSWRQKRRKPVDEYPDGLRAGGIYCHKKHQDYRSATQD